MFAELKVLVFVFVAAAAGVRPYVFCTRYRQRNHRYLLEGEHAAGSDEHSQGEAQDDAGQSDDDRGSVFLEHDFYSPSLTKPFLNRSCE